MCTFDGRTPTGAELHPVSLGLGEAIHRRGRPRLAEGEQAKGILERFAELSRGYETRLEIHEGIARIQI